MADNTDGPVTDPSQVDGPLTDPSQVDPGATSTPNTGTVIAPDAISGADMTGNPAGKFGFSYRGITDHGKKQAGGFFGAADQAVSDFEKQDEARTAQEAAANREHTDQYGRAIQSGINATNDYSDRDQALEKRLVDFNEHAAATEQRMNLEAQADRQQYISNYQEQLAGVKILAAQSGNPMAQLNGGQAIGLAGAMFAQGFLASRGINIDVGGQIDRWVDRSIAEHQQQIANARDLANDQLHLYEIARQNSQDEWEARQRYRGFVIAGLQTQIQANANRFQSQLANSQAQAQIAKLQIEADATQRQIADAHFTRVKDMMQLDFDRAYKQGMLSVEQYKAETDRLKAAGANQNAASQMWWTDPGQFKTDANGKAVSGGKFAFTVRPGLSKEATNKAIEDANSAHDTYEIAHDAAQRLRDLRKQVDGWGGWDKWIKDPQNLRTYEQQKQLLVLAYQHAITGSQASDKEREQYQKLLADDEGYIRSLFTDNSSNARMVDNFANHQRMQYQAVIDRPTYIKVGSSEAKRLNMAPAQEYDDLNTVDPATKWLGEQAVNPTTPAPPNQMAQDEAATVSQTRKGPENVADLGGVDKDGNGKTSPAYVQYLAQNAGDNPAKQPKHFLRVSGYRKEYAAMDRIAYEAVSPSGDREKSTDALLSLTRLAYGHTANDKKVDTDGQEYAKYLIGRIMQSRDGNGGAIYGAHEQFVPSVDYQYKPNDPFFNSDYNLMNTDSD